MVDTKGVLILKLLRALYTTVLGLSLTLFPLTVLAADTYTVDSSVICNSTEINPTGINTYPSAQATTYTQTNTYGTSDVVGFLVDGRLVEGTNISGNTMQYTFPEGSVGNHTIATGLASLNPEGFYLKLQGFTWEYRDDSIAVGTAYSTVDPNPQFKWEAYNLSTGEWTTIQDWSSSNWADWSGEAGNYWLHCSMRSADHLGYTSSTMCFHYIAGKTNIDKTYAGWRTNDILLGATSVNPNARLQFKIYNLDTKQWIYLTDENNTSNWVSWTPQKGDYWVHYEARTPDGRLADTKTYCFAVNAVPVFIN